MDLIDLRRLLTRLAMPLPVGLGLAIGAGAAALMLGRRPRPRRWAVGLATLGLLLLWTAAIPPTSNLMFRALEAPYPPRPSAACGGSSAPVDAIVVLGGAIVPQARGDTRGRLHRGSDRLREAALLFRAGCAPQLLISAGGGIDETAIGSEAHAIRALLQEFGVPESALLIEDASRTTGENAHYSARALGTGERRPRILLVTSAWHLRRAVPLFERAGFEVLPVGADYRSAVCRGFGCLLPDSGALDATGIAWKEYLGYWVQSLQR